MKFFARGRVHRGMLRNHKTLLVLGLFFLVAANCVQLARMHWHLLSENLSDGLMGFGYGLAIALLLLSIRMKTRASRCA